MPLAGQHRAWCLLYWPWAPRRDARSWPAKPPPAPTNAPAQYVETLQEQLADLEAAAGSRLQRTLLERYATHVDVLASQLQKPDLPAFCSPAPTAASGTLLALPQQDGQRTKAAGTLTTPDLAGLAVAMAPRPVAGVPSVPPRPVAVLPPVPVSRTPQLPLRGAPTQGAPPRPQEQPQSTAQGRRLQTQQQLHVSASARPSPAWVATLCAALSTQLPACLLPCDGMMPPSRACGSPPPRGCPSAPAASSGAPAPDPAPACCDPRAARLPPAPCTGHAVQRSAPHLLTIVRSQRRLPSSCPHFCAGGPD